MTDPKSTMTLAIPESSRDAFARLMDAWSRGENPELQEILRGVTGATLYTQDEDGGPAQEICRWESPDKG